MDKNSRVKLLLSCLQLNSLDRDIICYREDISDDSVIMGEKDNTDKIIKNLSDYYNGLLDEINAIYKF